MNQGDYLSVPPPPARRRAGLETMLEVVEGARRVVLSTHINADGDGAGSECAVAGWLAGLDRSVAIVNPTPFPTQYRHLVTDPSWVLDPGNPALPATIQRADLVLVLDTGEPKRLGRHEKALLRRPVAVIDHHVPSAASLHGSALVQDETACATGELVYDLFHAAALARPWPVAIAEALYTAIVTDTGSFRFSNTTPRAHAIAGDLIAQGVDPELVYRRIFATVPLRRVQLLRHALDSLQVDSELPITWMTITRDVMQALAADSEDLEGLVEHARSVEGTEVALFFRETADGATKVSFRSAGAVDVNALARQFGGGGHVKASGALLHESLDSALPRILEAVRAAVRAAATGFPGSPGGA